MNNASGQIAALLLSMDDAADIGDFSGFNRALNRIRDVTGIEDEADAIAEAQRRIANL